MLYDRAFYVKTYNRITPYLFGMLAGYYHRQDKDRNFQKGSVISEWIAFLTLIGVSCFRGWPASYNMKETSSLLWAGICRQIYGGMLAYLLLLIISPAVETNIPWYRPTKYMRWFLSLNIWVPIASLTYVIYLFHPMTLHLTNFVINKKRPADFPLLDPSYNDTSPLNCPAIVSFGWKEWLITYFLNIPLMMPCVILSYVLFEKAGIDSRSAFI